jgi:acyl carrier protein
MKPMTRETMELEVQNILMKQLNLDRDQMVPEARIMEDLGADSLDIAEITMLLEENFGVTIPDDEVEQLETVGTIHEALAQWLRL